MKRIIGFFVLLMLFILPLSAYAQEDGGNTNLAEQNGEEDFEEQEMEEEVEMNVKEFELLKTNNGMKVRLMQLQRNVVRNIALGDAIIERINEVYPDVETTDLEEKVLELQQIKDEIDVLLSEDPFYVSTEKFVQLKADAIKKTQEFRKLLQEALDSEQIAEIRGGISFSSEEYNRVNAQVNAKVREVNMEKSLALLEKFGIDDETLEEEIASGNLSAQEIKNKIMNAVREMNRERVQEMTSKIRTQRENSLRERHLFVINKLGGNSEDVLDIVKDDSLTVDEKEARLKVLARQRLEEMNQNRLVGVRVGNRS